MCKKVIYLEDAIEEINKIYDHIKLIQEKNPTPPLSEYAMYLDIIEVLKSLPSITEPEQNRGKWIKKHRHYGGFRSYTGFDSMGEQHTITVDERAEYDDLYCSECGARSADNFLNFCPNCGARMEVQE